IERALLTAGEVERVVLVPEEPGEPRADVLGPLGEAAGGRSRHIRGELRRLDALTRPIGELVTTRGPPNQRARGRPAPRRRGAGRASRPKARSCWGRCASAAAWRSASAITGAASTGGAFSKRRKPRAWSMRTATR